MADLDVEKKDSNGNDWWKWLLGILALAIILWLIFSNTGDDNENEQMQENQRTEEVDTVAHLETSPETPEEVHTYVARF